MSPSKPKRGGKGGKKKRVAFRRNRSSITRQKDWTERAKQAEGHELDAVESEAVRGKGDVSRHRTVVSHDDGVMPPEFTRGVVIAMRGLYADVNDGQQTWPCTIRRVLRTRLIEERHAVVVGDRVQFRLPKAGGDTQVEGVIEKVEPRTTQLRRRSGRRIQTLVANVDQVIIITSAAAPVPHPHLIDRYLVAALASELTPIICMNKIDLDTDGAARKLLDRYAQLQHATLATSAVENEGIELLRDVLRGKQSVVTGQSGVGKSSLLNAIQPELGLKTATVSGQTSLGRHTTTTARLFQLDFGGFVVDTPGIRSLDLTVVSRNEYEAYFTEFVEHLAHCRYPNCTHTHETHCSIKAAVDRGEIHQDRYWSYVRLFEEPGDSR